MRALTGCVVLALVASCSMAPVSQQGSGDRQYSWVDADGHMHMGVIAGAATPHADMAPAAAGSLPEAAAPQSATPGTATTVLPVAAGVAAVPAASGPGPRELFAPDEAFVDSTELERKHFNLDDKKKFGQVVDASGQLRTVYFDSGEGAIAPVAPALPDIYPVVPVMPGEAGWPLRDLQQACCQALSDKERKGAELELNRSYSTRLPSVACLANGSCKAMLLALDGKQLAGRKRDRLLRMRSFLSSPSCSKCVQWLTVVVLDGKAVPRRAYHSPLGGYRPETWHGYASFGYDLAIHPDDAYLLLLADEKGPAMFAGKSYTVVDKGEIAFTLIQ